LEKHKRNKNKKKKKKKNRATARHDFSFLLLINLLQQFLNHLQASSEMEWQQLPFVIKKAHPHVKSGRRHRSQHLDQLLKIQLLEIPSQIN
jgi:hypothetical protein